MRHQGVEGDVWVSRQVTLRFRMFYCEPMPAGNVDGLVMFRPLVLS